MIQIHNFYSVNETDTNKKLKQFQIDHPNWKIISISSTQAEFPTGWFITMTYDIEE